MGSLVIATGGGIMAALSRRDERKAEGAMLRKSMLLLIMGLVVLVGLSCTLTESLARRMGTEPTSTSRPRRTPRPTFTATPEWTATPTVTDTPTHTPIPPDTPTPLPPPPPTDTPVPPTDTPAPTRKPRPPTETPTPGPPTDTPVPDYPFVIAEQMDRTFSHTTNNFIFVCVAIVDANNTPLYGYKVVGDSPNVEFGSHVESAPSCADWCATTGQSGLVKACNVKFEPGPFIDGVWNIRVVDGGGSQVSPTVSLPYSTDPNQWAWDFIVFKHK